MDIYIYLYRCDSWRHWFALVKASQRCNCNRRRLLNMSTKRFECFVCRQWTLRKTAGPKVEKIKILCVEAIEIHLSIYISIYTCIGLFGGFHEKAQEVEAAIARTVQIGSRVETVSLYSKLESQVRDVTIYAFPTDNTSKENPEKIKNKIPKNPKKI